MNFRALASTSYGAVALGVLLGAFGYVRVGAVLIALGTGGVALSRGSGRAVERYLPLALALGLLVLAIVIPGGR